MKKLRKSKPLIEHQLMMIVLEKKHSYNNTSDTLNKKPILKLYILILIFQFYIWMTMLINHNGDVLPWREIPELHVLSSLEHRHREVENFLQPYSWLQNPEWPVICNKKSDVQKQNFTLTHKKTLVFKYYENVNIISY